MVRDPWLLTREHFLSVDETRDLLAGLARLGIDTESPEPSNVVDQVIVECLLWSGLQTSEFCRLAVTDVKFGERPMFSIRGQKHKRRDVFIPSRLVDLLKVYLKEYRPQLVARGEKNASGTDALILNERGRAYERTALYRRVSKILTRHDLGERASIQLLRHTYGYLAYLYSGSNLLFTQRQLGHAHPMVTAVYAQFVDEDYGAIADAIADRVEALPIETK